MVTMIGNQFFLLSLSIVFALAESYQLKALNIKFEVKFNNFENDVKHLYTMIRPDVEIGDIEFFKYIDRFMNTMIRLNDPKYNHSIAVQILNGKLSQSLGLVLMDKASELNITSKLIATFDNGLIMDYINGDDFYIQNYGIEASKELARRLAKFHKIKLDDPVHQFKWIEKRSFVDIYSESPILKDILLLKLNEFMEQNKNVIKEFTDNLPSFSNLHDEFKELHNFMLKNDAYGKICLCHNVLIPTNIRIDNTGIPYLTHFEAVSNIK